MHKRSATLAALLACLASAGVLAQDFRRHLSKAERAHALDGAFTVVTKTEAFPPKVKQAFAEITRLRSFSLANPGQKYQAADIVTEPRLPLRRLVFAGARDDVWFVHYERGGRGHGYAVVVFKADAGQRFYFLWGGAGFRRAGDLEELREMIDAGQFSDDVAFSW